MRQGSGFSTGLAPAIHQVHETQPGMGPDEAGTGITHHLFDLLALVRTVAVDGTVGAGALLFLERAVLQSGQSVAQQHAAGGAECLLLMVMVLAVFVNHQGNDVCFPLHPCGAD